MLNFSPFISSLTEGALPHINPAKRQTIAKGIISNNFLTEKNPSIIPNIPPINIGNKNNTHTLNFLNIFDIAYSNLSYNLNNIDIVDPLIPGTIIASPIKNPNKHDLNHDLGVYFEITRSFVTSTSFSSIKISFINYKTKSNMIKVMNNLYLVVGLGNPGKEYEHTRHNMGYDVVDKFADSLGTSIEKNDFHSLYTKVKYFDNDILLVKPLTYMNNSGIAIKEILDYFKIPVDNLIVIYDDMDFEPGVIKLKESGSSAGHNGIKSIINNLKTEKFKRIRVGTGKFKYNIIDYVLTKPTKEEQPLIDEAINKAVDAIKVIIKDNFQKAMNLYNQKDGKN